MSRLYQHTTVSIGLEHLFANSIIPQLFVDSEMLVRDFTPPVEGLFQFTAADRGRSIYEVKEKIGHRGLIGNIRGVIHTERNMEKEVQTAQGGWFRLNIQPNFSLGEERVDGVIITFSEIDRREPETDKVAVVNSEFLSQREKGKLPP